jgi:hypothetical protein
LGKYRRGKNKWTKEVGKIEKGRGISKEGIDLNNCFQLWDDNPLWVVNNLDPFMIRCFRLLGYGVRVRICKLKNKIMYNENEKVLGEETFQMFLVDMQH